MPPYKRLIIACDGTWVNSNDGFIRNYWPPGSASEKLAIPSNITRLCRALLPESTDGIEQIVFYQSGVGSTGGLFGHLGGLLGHGLGENIRQAYTFICNNYQEGDEIFLVGFSRGAFIARSLGSLIAGIGILTRSGLGAFYPIFKDWENQNIPGYRPKLETHSWPLRHRPKFMKGSRHYWHALVDAGLSGPAIPAIKAIGVFDTVGSLGVPTIKLVGVPIYIHSDREYAFTNTEVPPNVEYAFQALALDERRAPFSPTVWESPKPDSGAILRRLKQTWFPGSHSGIGGGYQDTSSSDITLAWMITQLSPFLAFDRSYVKRQREQNVEFYHRKGVRVLSWAMGLLQASDTALYASLTGRQTRTPGEYCLIDPITGDTTSQRLTDTCEFIHSSVHHRIKRNGAALVKKAGDYDIMDQTLYQPDALRDFRYVRSSKADRWGGEYWRGYEKWVKRNPDGSVTWIVEDTIEPDTAEMDLLKGWSRSRSEKRRR